MKPLEDMGISMTKRLVIGKTPWDYSGGWYPGNVLLEKQGRRRCNDV